jgi:cell volume regulation protein A
MLRAAGPALAIAGVLMFIARPLAVLVCLAPLRMPWRHGLFIGWVGLRGAVPIVLALIPLLDGVPDSGRFFNVAFAVVLASLLLQGTTLGRAARLLRVAEEPEDAPSPAQRVHGSLTLDADLPLADVLGFFELPMPERGASTLGEWMTQALARDHAPGDGLEWHGAHFRIDGLREGRIARVAVALAPRAA